MKYSIILITILVAFTMGCDEVDDLTKQDFTAPLEAEFTINTDSTKHDTTAVLDAATNKDFMDYKSRIEDVELQTISYQVVMFDNTQPGDSLKSGKVEFLNPVTNTYELLSEIRNQPLNQLNVLTFVAFDAVVAAKFVNSYKSDPYKATVRLNATMNKAPSHFKVAVTTKLKVKVKV